MSDVRFLCSRCQVYGPCRCDVCGMPSQHVGEIPQPTFRCLGCAEKEQRAWKSRLASKREEAQRGNRGVMGYSNIRARR